MAQINLSTKQNRLTGMEIRLAVAKREREEEGEEWTGNLELVDANYYI